MPVRESSRQAPQIVRTIAVDGALGRWTPAPLVWPVWWSTPEEEIVRRIAAMDASGVRAVSGSC